MKIDSTKKFRKQFKILPSGVQRQFDRRIKLFVQNRANPQLRDHGLKGAYLGYRSIDITGDVRALYYEKGDTVVIFAFIGTHSQLYG